MSAHPAALPSLAGAALCRETAADLLAGGRSPCGCSALSPLAARLPAARLRDAGFPRGLGPCAPPGGEAVIARATARPPPWCLPPARSCTRCRSGSTPTPCCSPASPWRSPACTPRSPLRSEAQGRANARWRGYLVMHVGLTLAFFREEFRRLARAGAGVPVFHRLGAPLARARSVGIASRCAAASRPASARWAMAVAAQPDGCAFAARPVLEQSPRPRVAARRRSAVQLFERPPELAGQVPPRTAALSVAMDVSWRLRALCAAWQGVRRAGPAPLGLALCAVRRAAGTAAAVARDHGAQHLCGALHARFRAARRTVGRRRGSHAARAGRHGGADRAARNHRVGGTLALQWTVQRSSDAVLSLSVLAAARRDCVAMSSKWPLSRAVGGEQYPTPRGELVPAVLARHLQPARCRQFHPGPRRTGVARGAGRGLEAAAALGSRRDHARLGAALPARGELERHRGAGARRRRRSPNALHAAPNTVVVSLIPGQGWSWANWREYLRGHEAMTESSLSPMPLPRRQLSAAGLVRDHANRAPRRPRLSPLAPPRRVEPWGLQGSESWRAK